MSYERCSHLTSTRDLVEGGTPEIGHVVETWRETERAKGHGDAGAGCAAGVGCCLLCGGVGVLLLRSRAQLHTVGDMQLQGLSVGQGLPGDAQ